MESIRLAPTALGQRNTFVKILILFLLQVLLARGLGVQDCRTETEVDKQREFYDRIGINPDLHHNTDGVDRGNLYENKLHISNTNTVLFQAVKYASRICERGEKLKDRIIPYAEPDNLEFKAIMDCLNPAFLQRELGAYYTPA
ncbi:MAG: hypothetical protein LBI47_00960, partial [Puniceicoccales bacterium]|nr:hypothetical protein [Puniceicoccales bacterium]